MAKRRTTKAVEGATPKAPRAPKAPKAPRAPRAARTSSRRKSATAEPLTPEQVELAQANQAIEADLEARKKVDAERGTLEKRLEKLERESAENERKYQDSATEVAQLRAKLDKPGADQPPVAMKAQAFDEEKSREQFRQIRPLNDPRRARILALPPPKAKTFLVTPIGRGAGNLSPAVVSNCADEGDAKCEYFRRTGATPHKVQVDVKPFGETLRELEERQEKAEQLAGDPLVDDLAAFEAFRQQRHGAAMERSLTDTRRPAASRTDTRRTG